MRSTMMLNKTQHAPAAQRPEQKTKPFCVLTPYRPLSALSSVKGLGCFAAGTRVRTQDGMKAIEDIKVGDYVLSKPEFGDGEMSYKRVTKTFEYDNCEVYLVVYRPFDGPDGTPGGVSNILIVTPNHPFWVVNSYDIGYEGAANARPANKWLRADQLIYGDSFLLEDGKRAYVEEVSQLYRTPVDSHVWAPAFNFYQNPYDEPEDRWHEDRTYMAGSLVNLFGFVERKRPKLYNHGRAIINDIEFERVHFSSLYKNSLVKQDDLENEELFYRCKVYNLEVEGNHTYFVGMHGIWVHHMNGECLGNPASKKNCGKNLYRVYST